MKRNGQKVVMLFEGNVREGLLESFFYINNIGLIHYQEVISHIKPIGNCIRRVVKALLELRLIRELLLNKGIEKVNLAFIAHYTAGLSRDKLKIEKEGTLMGEELIPIKMTKLNIEVKLF